MSWMDQFSLLSSVNTNTNTQNNPNNSFIKNENIKKDANITSNWEYRNYLQNNANSIMKFNIMSSVENSGNNPFIFTNNKEVSNQPFLFKSTHDTSNPHLGMNPSNLKNDYISSQQIKARMISPIIPTNI